MVLFVHTDATVSTAPVMFYKETNDSSGIPSKYNVSVEWYLKLMHVVYYCMHLINEIHNMQP